MYSLGEATGVITLNTAQALRQYATLRSAHATTLASMASGYRAARTIGLAFLGMGTAVAAGFGMAVKATADFEYELAFFQAVTNATAKDMEGVRKLALQLGVDTAYGAQEVAEAFVELGKAGVGVQDLAAGVGRAVITLAAAADISTQNAAIAVVNTLKTFQLGADQAVHVADQLAGAANASTIEIDDIATSMKYAGAAANALKIPLDDVTAAIALLGNNGIRGSTAGTSLRRVLLNLNPASVKAAEAMKELGIITEDGKNRFYDAEGNAKSLAEIFQILKDSTAGLTQAEKVRYLNTIFGNRAIASALILTEGGAKAIQDYKAQIANVTAEEVMQKRLDNLAGSLKRLKAAFSTAFIALGSPAQEPIKRLVDALTSLIKKFTELSPETQKLIVYVGLAMGALFLLGGAFILAVGFAFRLVEAFIRLGQAFGFIKNLRLVAGAFGLLKGAIGSLFSLLLTNPIGWVILALVALGAAVVVAYKKIKPFRDWVNMLWESLKQAWTDIVNFFKGLPAFFSNLWNTVKNAFVTAWNAIFAFFAGLPSRIGAWLAGVGQSFMAFINTVITFFAQLPAKIPYYLGVVIGFLLGWGARAILWAVSTGRAIVEGIINFIMSLPSRISTWFQQAYAAVVKWLSQTVASARTKAAEIVAGIINFIVTLPGRVSTFFQNMRQRAVSALVTLVSNARQKASEIVSGIINFFANLPSRTSQWFGNARDAAVRLLANLWSKAVDFARRIVSGITGTISRIPGAVSGVFQRAIDAIKSVIRRAFDAAASFAKGLWNGFKKGLGISSPSFIEEAMFALNRNLVIETKAMSKHVARIQRIGKTLPGVNDAAKRYGISTASPTLSEQASDRAREAVAQSGRPVEINIYNPVEEKSSITIQRTMTRLAVLGVGA